jgi:hypothetical protein
VQEELLGRLLGALDDDEQESVASRLSEDPKLREQLFALETRLRRLESHRTEFDPPPGLAQRTCALVAAHEKPSPGPPKRPAMSPEVSPPAWISRVRWLDVAMALGVFFAAAMLAIPAVQNSRFRSQITACQDNLRVLGESLTQYSERYAGYFPVVPTEGNAASPSIYAPTLAECELLSDASRVFCPAAPTTRPAEEIELPTLKQVHLARGDELLRLRQMMGGDYGYSYGYMDGNVYRATRNLRRFHFAIMSDVPSGLPERQSLNHGGRGQNVLFEDGRVMFVPRPRIDTSPDDFFINDRGLVGPGLHLDDSVIGPGNGVPIVPVDLR